VQAGEHRLRRRISERLDAGLKAGLLAGGDDVSVVKALLAPEDQIVPVEPGFGEAPRAQLCRIRIACR
jgi:hypothetical protein